MKTGTAYCQLSKNILSSPSLPTNGKIKIYRTINWFFFRWVWNLVSHIKGGICTEGETSGAKRDGVTGEWSKLHHAVLTIRTAHHNAVLTIRTAHRNAVLTIRTAHHNAVLTIRTAHHNAVLTIRTAHHNAVLTIRTAHQMLCGWSNLRGKAVGALRTREQGFGEERWPKETTWKNQAEMEG